MATRLPAPRRFRRRWLLLLLVIIALVVGVVWGVKLWRLWASVDEYAAWWTQPRGEPGGLVYVALGDSAAQGIGASTPDDGYVSLLADRMRERTGHPVLVVNLSRSGATVRDVVEQLPRLAWLRADVITVGVGGNDIGTYDQARYHRDITALVDRLPAGTVIADIPYFMHGQAHDDASQAAATIRVLAERRGLVVAPLRETMRARGWIAMFTDYAADWFHPNDRGYRVWADAFWAVLESRVPGASEHTP